MISSDFRTEARRKLAGKWGKVAIITLAYMVLFFVLGFIEGLFKEGSAIRAILSLVVAIIEVPLAFGFIIALFKVYNSEDVKAFDFCSLGFSNFAKSWKISLYMLLKMIVPIILMIVSIFLISFGVAAGATSALLSSSSSGGFFFFSVIGFILYIVSIIWIIMLSYYYSMSYVIAADNPELEAKQAVLKSREMMTGNRGKLFCLQFSFIGWAILASCTLGIGYLWLLPYIQFATFAFYFYLAGKSSNTTASVEEEVIKSNDNTDSLD